MTRPQYGAPHAQSVIPAAAARLLRWLLAAYALFVVYGSLVPLNFHPIPLAEAWDQFVHAPFLMLGIGSRADWVANLLLFIPLAFLARAVLPAPAGPMAALALPSGLWALCTLLAAAIEFTQTFFPGRTVSLNDPLAESLGAVIGLALHRLAGRPMLQWLAGWWDAETERPLATRVLHGYLVALCLMSLMPLDLTISPVEVYHKAREGRVVLLPFSDLPHDLAQAVYDMVTDVLIWLPVGLLWRWGGRSPWQVLGRGALAAAALEVLQLFVWSRVSSSTDVITGALGCALGAWLGGRGRPAALAAGAPGAADADSAHPHAMTGLALRLPWGWLLGLWLIVALSAFWYPFDARFDGTWLAMRWQQAWRVPFSTYYQGTEFHALNELVRKLLFFMPGGLLWALHVAGEYPWRRPALMRMGFAGLPLVALLVEAGQLLLPEKIADLTDACIEAAGACLGLMLGRRLWHGGGASISVAPVPAQPGTAASAATGTTHDPASPAALPASLAAWPAALTVLAVLLVAATAWLGWRGLPRLDASQQLPGRVWLALWLVLVTCGALASAWRPWVTVAAFFGCQFVTPRYDAVMGLLLATPALPGLAGLAALGTWIHRRRLHGRWRPELLPDGLFVLFFAWMGMLGWMAWQRMPPTAFDPLYQPANYAWCALMYWSGRQGNGNAMDHRRLAVAVVAAVAAGTAVQLATGQFMLNGHVALLLVLALPLLHGLSRSASSAGERVVWRAVAALVVLAVVLNQNRSALLAMLAVGLLALPRPRQGLHWIAWGLAALGGLGLLWQLGLLDRFLALTGGQAAAQRDGLAVATVESRLALWDAAWAIVQAHPVAGVGPGLFEYTLGQVAPQLDKVPAHNTWLTLLAETGVVGALLGTLAFLAAWGASTGGALLRPPPGFPVQQAARAGLVACAVFGLFNSRADFAWAYLLAGLAVPPAPSRR